MGELTQLLDLAQQGNGAARDQFFARIYEELDQLARQHLSKQSPLTLLDPSDLVRESYLRIERRGPIPFSCRGEFLAYASKAMRCVIIDYVRARGRERRGGGQRTITLTGSIAGQVYTEPQMESLGDALECLQQIDERAHSVVEMRFFGGMELEEISRQLAISLATVKRDWSKARGFLLQAMNEPPRVA